MIPAVVVMFASRPFLLDVRDLTIGRELPVVTGDATAPEVRKAEETDEAHHPKNPVDGPNGEAADAADATVRCCF